MDGKVVSVDSKQLFQSLIHLIAYLSISTNAQSSIDWSPCTMASLQDAGAECGFLLVPMDHSNPDSEKIQIALSRIRHNVTREKYQGIMLLNPGGPGGSGLHLSLTKLIMPSSIGDAYDWIGFDPRGVGQSQPSLSCDSKYAAAPRPDYVAQNSNENKYWIEHAKKYAANCMKNHRNIIPFIGSRHVARDMDKIRIAFGESKINYIGYSYGTYLGQIYATLFPTRVRRMILDGVVDTKSMWFNALLHSNYGFDRNFGLWFIWLAKYNSDYNLGKTSLEVKAKWDQIVQELKVDYMNRTMGPSDWLDSFFGVPYRQKSWPSLGKMFSEWYHHRNTSFISDISQTITKAAADNPFAVVVGVLAGDAFWPKTVRYNDQKQWWSYARAPLTTWRGARLFDPVRYLPVKNHRRFRVIGRKRHRFLLVGAELDAATPIEGAFETRKRFQSSRLIFVAKDMTHGTSLGGNACVDNVVFKYLEFGILPRRKRASRVDVLCSPPADPQPSSNEVFNEQELKDIIPPRIHFI